MYNFLTKHGTAVAFGLGVLVTLIALLTILGGLDEFNMLSDEEKGTTSIFNPAISMAIALTIACAVAILGFGLFHVVMDPRSALKFIIGFAVIIGLVFLFYSMADVETSGKIGTLIENGELSANTSKWISGALSTTLVLLAGTFLAFIVSEIRNLFK